MNDTKDYLSDNSTPEASAERDRPEVYETINIRVTPAQKAVLRETAAARGLSLGPWLRSLGLEAASHDGFK